VLVYTTHLSTLLNLFEIKFIEKVIFVKHLLNKNCRKYFGHI